jgi:hypothetical protein
MVKETTQVKFTIDTDVVSAFKNRCRQENASMTSEIRRYMMITQPAKARNAKTDTRPHRRKAVLEIIDRLHSIMELEACYRDAIPEQFTQRIEDADHACDQLAEAIDCLESVF